MMARKLSATPRSGVLVVFAAAAVLSAAPASVRGQNAPSARAIAAENPFAARDAASDALPVEQSQPQRTASRYRNPFKDAANEPHPRLFRFGPTGRWRQGPPAVAAASPVKSAILSVEAIPESQAALDALTAISSLGGQDAADKAGLPIQSPLEPPDPARFASGPVAQPSWLSDEAPTAFSPIDQTVFEQPLTKSAAEPLPSGPRFVSEAPIEDEGAPSDDEPFIVSDYEGNPAGWLAEAEQKADRAQSMEELSDVLALCQRVLRSDATFDEAVAARRRGARIHNRLGEMLVDAGRQEEAMAEFESAIALDNSCVQAIHNRAVQRALAGDYETALADFNRAIELDPSLGVVFRNRAELLAAQGNLNDALEDYTRAINAMPDDAELRRARAHAYQSLGDWEAAIRDLNHSIQLDPTAAEGLAQRGNLMAERGDFAHALADLKQAVAIDSELAEAYRSLAWLYATCPDKTYRNSEAALSAAQHAQQLSPPGDHLAAESLAVALASDGRFDEAVEAQRQAIQAAPAEQAASMRERLALYESRLTMEAESGEDARRPRDE